MSLFENLAAREGVDGEGGDDAEPGGPVAEGNAEKVPGVGDPAPEDGRAVNFASRWGADKEEDEGDKEGRAVA